MKATYTALGSIVAILAITHLFWGDQPGLVRDFAPELATEVLGILKHLKSIGITSIAVCLLNSYQKHRCQDSQIH